MTVAVTTLIPARAAPASQTTLYTANSRKAIIDKLTGTNVTASAASLSVNLVPTAGSAAANNVITQSKVIQPGETYTFPELVGHVLDDGAFISVIASVASAITIMASGREIT